MGNQLIIENVRQINFLYSFIVKRDFANMFRGIFFLPRQGPKYFGINSVD